MSPVLDAEIDERARGRLGTVLRGKYRLESVLGVGGMAVVFAATHRNAKRFAVKVLNPEFSVREDFRRRFLREGYLGNTVHHPGAVTVLDDDVAEDGAAFLVMELLEGCAVERLWEASRGKLPLAAVLGIAHQLLDVLEAAHAKQIVHRDVKPANLFVLPDGTLKVLDFGIARVRDAALSGHHATETGALFGTPAYMAPEQAAGNLSAIDARTDLWAVGATIFTLLTGSAVHEGEIAQQIVFKAGTEKARSLAVMSPELDRHVVELVDRALAFERDQRWPSAATMRDAVRDAHRALFGGDPSRKPLEDLVRTAKLAGEATVPSTPAPRGSTRLLRPIDRMNPLFGPKHQRAPAPTVVGTSHSVASPGPSSMRWWLAAALGGFVAVIGLLAWVALRGAQVRSRAIGSPPSAAAVAVSAAAPLASTSSPMPATSDAVAPAAPQPSASVVDPGPTNKRAAPRPPRPRPVHVEEGQ
jgi:serine/threonine-protein kinase